MKTRILTAIGALTLLAFTVTADEALLSPRAKSSLPATATNVPTAPAGVKSAALESPRAATGKIAVVSGRETAMRAVCTTIGAPRQAGMFASCCKVAPQSCQATPAACCKK